MSSSRLGALREITQRLLRRKATGRLKKVLAKSHVADVAATLRFLNHRDRKKVFDLLPDRDVQGELLAELDSAVRAEIAAVLADDLLVDLLSRMSSDDAADLLGDLPEARGNDLLKRLSGDGDQEDLEGLMRYGEETAGGLMVPECHALPEDTTAEAAVRSLQTAADVEMVFYVYVVNEHGQLVGVVSLRQLVTCPPQTRLADLMESEVISVHAQEDREEVARVVARYNVLAVPVVDDANKLLGIVTVDDVIDVIREEATEDFLKMAGTHDEDILEVPTIGRSARVRMPWLLASFGGGIGAAMILRMFESSLSHMAALAAFIPIITGMGGNVGTQSSTLMVRGIATGRIDMKALWRTVGRETAVGAAMGAAYGLLLALITYGLYAGSGDTVLGLAGSVGLAILSSMTVAAVVGTGLPLLFHRLSIDPAVATGPFVTTAVDIGAVLIYFGIARSLVPGLGG